MTAPSDMAGMPRPSFRAGSPEEVLAVVPDLLGFVPQSSIVVIGTEPSRGNVKVTLRYDLPAAGDPQAAADIARHALAVLAWQRLAAAVAVGYGPGALVTPVATAFRSLAEDSGMDPAEFWRVEDGRYWSCTCTKACCPAEGTPFDATAHLLQPGLASATEVLASRDAVAASIAPPAAAAAESMRQAIRQAEQLHLTRVLVTARDPRARAAARRALVSEALAAVTAMIAAYRDGGQYTASYQLAWPVVALKDPRVRDDAWARMDRRYTDAHLRMWTDVVRHALPGYVAAPASLLAFVAWQAGNGVLANVALDRALADDPDYTAADLLRTVIGAGAPPSMADSPVTPEDVAACYDLDHGAGSDLHGYGGS